ncbi:MAG TPA: chromosome segregation protein SMC [Cyclobacteriaceae bacterium]|nr:chromosome segregation protein SMC [Cyclobacteriaceae bacterium]
MSEAKPNPVEPKKASNKTAIIIALLSIVVIIQSIKIYLDYQEKVEVNEQLAVTEEDLASTMQRLNEIQTELNEKIAEIEKLGGDITELQKAKAEVDAELKRTRSRTSRNIKELKDRVEGYEQLLKLKDEELEKLKSLNKELYSENRTLKTKQNELSDSINRLSKNTDELANKVAIASQLKAENIQVVSVNARGRERTSPFRSKQLETLKVEFNIAENKVAPIEGKKIMIKVTDENGQVIFDVAKGSGTFMLDGKEEFYTAAQEILFDNTRQKLTFLYEKGSEYASGNYTVDIYTDGYKMGQMSFSVK